MLGRGWLQLLPSPAGSGVFHPRQLWTKGLKSLGAPLEQVGSESSLELLVKRTRPAKSQASRFPTSPRTSTRGATPRNRTGPGGAGLIFRLAGETKEDRHPATGRAKPAVPRVGQYEPGGDAWAPRGGGQHRGVSPALKLLPPQSSVLLPAGLFQILSIQLLTSRGHPGRVKKAPCWKVCREGFVSRSAPPT